MYKHTPGFYTIELHRTKCQHDISRTALGHQNNDRTINDFNATMCDYLIATARQKLNSADKINAIEDIAYQHIKMSRIKRWLFDKKQRIK